MGLTPPASKRLQRAARDLMSHPDVVGVFWGDRSRRGRWTGERCVSVHVLRKQHRDEVSRERRLPSTLAGYRVDVVDVGRPRAHWLGHTDEVTAKGTGGTEPRRSTATLYFVDDGGIVRGLFSGHGVLPIRSRKLVRHYDQQRDTKARFTVVDESAGFYSGYLMKGCCQRDEDWALASFPLIKPDELDPHHLAAGVAPPIPQRRGRLAQGEQVWHYSRVRGRHKRFAGVVRHVELAGVKLSLPDNTEGHYACVISVSGSQGKDFSVPGDSGSLVVDMARRAVGTIVGGSSDGKISYILGMGGIKRALGDRYAKGFR